MISLGCQATNQTWSASSAVSLASGMCLIHMKFSVSMSTGTIPRSTYQKTCDTPSSPVAKFSLQMSLPQCMLQTSFASSRSYLRRRVTKQAISTSRRRGFHEQAFPVALAASTRHLSYGNVHAYASSQSIWSWCTCSVTSAKNGCTTSLNAPGFQWTKSISRIISCASAARTVIRD